MKTHCCKESRSPMCRRQQLVVTLVLLMSLALTSGFETGPCSQAPMCSCKWSRGKMTADCTNAGLNRIPTTLSSSIQALILDGNPLRRLSKDAFKIAGLLNVKTLSLRGCSLQDIDPYAFRDLKIMTTLDLSANNLTEINAHTFDGNEQLNSLKLSHNPLIGLKPYQFPPLHNLKSIDLSHCHLRDVDRSSFKNLGASVDSVMLHNNELTFIREEVFIPLVNLNSITLHSNPWICDCKLKNFRDWVVNKKLFDGPAECVEPSRLNGKKWNEVLPIEFACKPDIELPVPRVFGAPGVDATLSCKITGSPVPMARWVVNGRIVNNNTHPTPFADQTYYLRSEPITFDGIERWFNLTITNPSEHDLGTYLCVAENNGGVMERGVILTFDDPSSYTSGIPITDEQWHILIGASVCILILLILLIIVCYCCLCRKQSKSAKNNQHKNGYANNENGPDSQKLLNSTNGLNGSIVAVSASSNPVPKPPRMGEYTGVPQTDLYNFEMQTLPRAPSVNGSSCSTTMTMSKASFSDHYPDLLEHRHYFGAKSSADNILSPASLMLSPIQQAQYAPHLISPFQRSGTLPLPHHQPHHHHQQQQQQHQPFPTSQSYTVQPLPVVHQQYRQARPGYVTLPRRPRTSLSVPRDTPSPSLSTLSRNAADREPIYDGIGPRTSADGSSRLSLHKSSPNGGASLIPTPKLSSGSSRPGFVLPPYHAPIKEIQECPSTPKPKSTPNLAASAKRPSLPSDSLAASSSEATLIEENISAYCEPFGKAEKPQSSNGDKSNRNSITSNESELDVVLSDKKNSSANSSASSSAAGPALPNSSSTPIDVNKTKPSSGSRNGGPPKTLPKPKVKPVPPPKPKKSFQDNSVDTPLISFQDEGADGSEV